VLLVHDIIIKVKCGSFQKVNFLFIEEKVDHPVYPAKTFINPKN